MSTSRSYSRSDLAQAILMQRGELTQAQVNSVLRVLFDDVLPHCLAQGQVTIKGFGNFSLSHRGARTLRNPANGETIAVPASVVPRFKAAPSLKRFVSERASPASSAA